MQSDNHEVYRPASFSSKKIRCQNIIFTVEFNLANQVFY